MHETSGIERIKEPLSIGIPFPNGVMREKDHLNLVDDKNNIIPIQVTPLAYWPDNSLKWTLLDFQTTIHASDRTKYNLRINTELSSVKSKISIDKISDIWKIDTGPTIYYIDSNIFKPFSKIILNGKDIVDGPSSKVVLIDNFGKEYNPEIENIITEISGHLRSVIKVEGAFKEKNKQYARFIARIHFFVNKSFVKIDFTLWNPKPAKHTGGLWDLGDKGSVLFKDLYIRTTLNSKEPVKIQWKTQPTDLLNTINPPKERRASPMNFYPVKSENHLTGATNSSNLVIYQDSSGGDNWRSSNHVNRHGDVPLSFKGYQVKEDDRIIAQGLRANPFVYLGDEKIGISCAIKNFWQNYPKALQVKDRSIIIRLFPGYFQDYHELQGGERKTHTVFLDFGGKPDALGWIQNPLIPVIPSNWYSKTKAIPYLSDHTESSDALYETFIEPSVKGENSFFHRREVVDEYGWRNFGDIYADHEAVEYQGKGHLISHYNNQYDLICSFLRQYVSTSDFLWYELMNDLARHVVDIDIYHTDHDRDEYNGGMFWHTNHYLDASTCTHRSVSKTHKEILGQDNYGGGPGLEHNYTTGLLFHYYMTGSVSSKDAVLGLADWVINNIDSPNTLLGTLKEAKDNLSLCKKIFSGTKVRSDRFPFTRGSGNSINTMIDAFNLTGNRSYLEKAEEIIQGCIHPKDDIESRDLLNAESSWSYTVFLQAVGKYLDVKLEIGKTDYMFWYAKESFLHYADWMIVNEYPYLEKPEILEFPNETWAAQDLRKSCIFYFAAKYCNNNMRSSYLKKANFFFNHSLQELNTFETCSLTRPIALLLQNGYMHFYFLENPNEKVPVIGDE